MSRFRKLSHLKHRLHLTFLPSPEEIKELTIKMVNQRLVTKQTTSEGLPCNSVMVAERKFPRREFYFAIAMEREANGPVVIASRHGGVNIEDVARDIPGGIIREPIDIEKGVTKEFAEWIVRRVGICDQPATTVNMLCNLYDLFVEKDALLVEINPYVEDVCLNYFALDAKLNFDDSAEFRQCELFKQRDETQEDPKETAARKFNMSYIAMDGSIGCMVNGAGLAMATNDILKLYCGEPANFLDVGSMASAQAVKQAVEIILMDKKVRAIFVNVHGGMMRCDHLVEGLLKAVKELDITIPIVCRLQGNKAKEGQKMLRDANTSIITREDFADAAETAVRCADIMEIADERNLKALVKMNVKCDCGPVAPKQKPPSKPTLTNVPKKP